MYVVPWLDQFDISRSYVMMAIFLLQVVVGLISPAFGRIMDQRSMRWLVVAGAIAMSLGLLILSYATAFWVVILVHLTLLPVGMVLCGSLLAQTLVSKWFTAKRGLAIGISAMGTSLGGLVFPLITSTLIAQYDWRIALQVLGVLTLLVMLPLNVWILRVEPPSSDITRDGLSGLESKIWASGDVLRSRSFWIPVIGLIPINAAFGGVQFNLGAYVFDLGFNQQLAAQLISVTSISMIMGKFVFGGLGDRVDHRKLYWLMVVVLLIALMLFEGSPGKSQLLLAAAFQGFATGGVMPMMGLMSSARFGIGSFGKVLGYFNLFLMFGSLGSIFSGWVFDLTQSYDYAFWFFAATLPPCAVLMYFLPAPATSD